MWYWHEIFIRDQPWKSKYGGIKFFYLWSNNIKLWHQVLPILKHSGIPVLSKSHKVMSFSMAMFSDFLEIESWNQKSYQEPIFYGFE